MYIVVMHLEMRGKEAAGWRRVILLQTDEISRWESERYQLPEGQRADVNLHILGPGDLCATASRAAVPRALHRYRLWL